MTHLPDPRRKRLLFRSWHRGTREADLILGSFAERAPCGFDEAQLDRYEALLDVPDPEIFDWLTGRAAPPPDCNHDVTRLLLAFRIHAPADMMPLDDLAKALGGHARRVTLFGAPEGNDAAMLGALLRDARPAPGSTSAATTGAWRGLRRRCSSFIPGSTC